MTNRIIDFFIELFIKYFGFISYKLSIKGRVKLGKFLGDIIMLLSPKRKIITINNLKNAFPDKNMDWCRLIARKSFHNLTITFLEFIIFDKLSDSQLNSLVRFEDINGIIDAYKRGKGLILMSGHFGNWELTALSFGYFSQIPVKITVKKQKFADEFYNIQRTCKGNEVVEMSGSAREVVKVLLNKGTIALLADQNATVDRDIFVEFFGRKVPTYKAPAELALRFDVPIIFGFCIRQENGNYIIKTSEIHHNDLSYSKEAVEELTRRHVVFLEGAIIKYPELWAWQHRRWKHSKR